MRTLGLLALLALVASAPDMMRAAAPTLAAQVIVLSNSAPHISVIDAATNRVVKTADVPQMTSWAWNDADNYSDGMHLWLGMRNPDTDDVEVVLLDVNTLQIARRIPLGKDSVTLYLAKPSRRGTLLVSKHASAEVAVIDRRTYAVAETAKVPVNNGFACDIDVALGPDGVERAFVPTRHGNTVVSLDAARRKVLKTRAFAGTEPFMLTASPDARHVWVEERTGNSLAILAGHTLDMVRRIPTGRSPIVGTFSPDGAVHYTGHAADVTVMAHDTRTMKELWRARVGTNPDKVGVHPAGTFVYAGLSREAAVAVLDARTGDQVARVALGTNPAGLFVRRP